MSSQNVFIDKMIIECKMQLYLAKFRNKDKISILFKWATIYNNYFFIYHYIYFFSIIRHNYYLESYDNFLCLALFILVPSCGFIQ